MSGKLPVIAAFALVAVGLTACHGHYYGHQRGHGGHYYHKDRHHDGSYRYRHHDRHRYYRRHSDAGEVTNPGTAGPAAIG